MQRALQNTLLQAEFFYSLFPWPLFEPSSQTDLSLATTTSPKNKLTTTSPKKQANMFYNPIIVPF